MTVFARFLLLAIALNATPVAASLMVVPISAETLDTSPIVFTLEAEEVEHLLAFTFSLPAGQTILADLWRTDIWLRADDGAASLVVPLALSFDEESRVYTATFHLTSELARRAVVALRCGEHAPLAEVAYQIDVGAFVR